ncbi:SDR family NAD(P)-dependent oxidoreductase [Pseudomonas agarici]|nr:SDR family oxidoreductase [Pseudomonas agarici]
MMSDANLALFRLDGHRALVTGASGGLGQRFAVTLASAGADIVVAARRRDRLAGLVDQIRAMGRMIQAVELDVTDSATIKAAFDEIEQHGPPVDILVNTAGVTVSKAFLEQSEADWDHVLNTNLRGTWRVAQECARRLVDSARPGSIINVASILGERVASHVGPYAVSKAGLIQASKTTALELARYGIRVNALLPGYIATDLNQAFLQSEAGLRLRDRIPSRRFGHPQDLDGPLLLLASDAGRHITGATLAVDGGHLISSL